MMDPSNPEMKKEMMRIIQEAPIAQASQMRE
jgi:hypothetical protein